MKKNLQYLLFVFLIVVLSACSGNKTNTEPGTKLISSNLEDLSWMNLSTLVKDVAHSGKFSSKLDSVSQFSFGFSNIFSSIGDTLPISVDVSVWVFYPHLKIKSSIVMSIDSMGKSIFWKGIPLNDSIKNANQWQEVKGSFEIPKNIMPTDNVKIYVWNNDKRTFYIDDLSILFHNQ